MAINILPIAVNTFREAVRNKILYSVILFAAVLIVGAASFGSVSIGSQEKVIKDFGLFSLSFFGAVISIISGVSLLNKELKQKTIFNILSKPVKRWEFILGKYLGLTFTVSLLVSLMGVALIGFVACFEGKVDWLLFQAVLFTLLEIAVVSATTIFFSSLVVTTTLSGIFSLGMYLAGRSIAYFSYFLTEGEGYDPTLAPIIRVLDWIIPDLTLFSVNDLVVYGVSSNLSHFLYALCYGLGYSTITLCLASLIFSRREFT